MGKAEKSTAPDIGQVVVRDPGELLLTLKPAELEALLVRLCTCGTRRLRSGAPRHARRRCAGGSAGEWCRLGTHALPGYVESKLG
jgi:hypothetical protein